jgi:Flp pilus assembly protein TadD
MFQELLERDEENLSLKSSVAYIYAMSGKTEEAKQIYTELINIHPENSSFLENYIAILLLEENIDESTAQLEKFKEQFPENSNIDKIQKHIDSLIKEKSEDKESETSQNETSEELNISTTENVETNKSDSSETELKDITQSEEKKSEDKIESEKKEIN